MSANPTSALVEEATVADGMSARIRDLVCIVENYDPDSEDEDRDDRCPECKTPLGAPEEPGMEPTPFCNCCAHAVVEELAEAVQGLRQVIRQAETDRDAALKQSAAWEIQAQDLRDRLVKAEAERDAQHDLVLRLTAEWDEAKADAVRMLTAASQQAITNARLAADRDEASVVHACPPKGSGVMPCCGATAFEKPGDRLTTNPALVTCDRQRLAADLDEARAQVATLELLRRGGK